HRDSKLGEKGRTVFPIAPIHKEIQRVPQRVVLGIGCIDLGQVRAQTRSMLPYVPDGEDQVGCEFVLDLQLPVLDHAGAAVVESNVADRVVCERVQRWILGVARWRVGGETCLQGRNGRKLIGILEVRIGGRAAAEVTSKIWVCEGGVGSASASPNNGFWGRAR